MPFKFYFPAKLPGSAKVFSYGSTRNPINPKANSNQEKKNVVLDVIMH